MSLAERAERSERDLVAAARTGDEQAFAELITPYRRELHVHCYRLLGSFADAEDAYQECLVRAWRGLDGFHSRAPFRAWLYRIATNASLRSLERRRREPAWPPPGVDLPPGEHGEPVHVGPYPDRLIEELADAQAAPDARYEEREAVELVFVAALQALPPRQRAVLALRDVLGFAAAEVAELLETSTASVNSALQRARAALERERRAGRLGSAHAPASAEGEQALVRRFVEAWHAGDLERLVGLLKEDALLTMPPLPVRYVGPAGIARFFSTVPAGGQGQFDRIRLVSTRANGRPALAAYAEDEAGGPRRAYGLMAVGIDGAEIASIVGFADPSLFRHFGLPETLEEG